MYAAVGVRYVTFKLCDGRDCSIVRSCSYSKNSRSLGRSKCMRAG